MNRAKSSAKKEQINDHAFSLLPPFPRTDRNPTDAKKYH